MLSKLMKYSIQNQHVQKMKIVVDKMSYKNDSNLWKRNENRSRFFKMTEEKSPLRSGCFRCLNNTERGYLPDLIAWKQGILVTVKRLEMACMNYGVILEQGIVFTLANWPSALLSYVEEISDLSKPLFNKPRRIGNTIANRHETRSRDVGCHPLQDTAKNAAQ
jgi:hypothetical protein